MQIGCQAKVAEPARQWRVRTMEIDPALLTFAAMQKLPQVDIREYSTATAMLADWAEWLEQHAANYNLLLGMLYRLRNREAGGGEVDALLVGVFQDGQPMLAFLRTPPRELIMATAARDWEGALAVAANWMRANQPDLPGLVGPEPQTSALAEAYHPDHHCVFRQKTMQLDHLVMPRPSRGMMRLSEPRDVDLIRDWLVSFFLESLRKELKIEEATQLARAKIMEKAFWVWEVDGLAVSMAGVERPTRHGITIVLVYTPQSARGQGFASNLVAQITQLQLQNGKRFCCLHTDADNPTSNKIYREMGYYEVGEGGMFRFGEDGKNS